MCGIAGIVGPTSDETEPVLRSMLGLLRHRGPDDDGVGIMDGVALGARRLAIIDVAGGHQPIYNEDRNITAVQNGEIYNFVELRAALQRAGHIFRTRSDTEVLPHAYEEWGSAFVSRLRGMFALAVWDGRRRQLVLARDRFGKKPLVYAETTEGFVFASEIQALLAHPSVGREVDPLAIDEYLTLGYIPAPRTAFAQIRKLEPAHILTRRDGTNTAERYWAPRFEPKLGLSVDEAAEALRTHIDEAVRLRMISDVPIGAFLSGGLDSSTVVAFMARHSERPVRTFSVGFRDGSLDEREHARLVARTFGTAHEEFVVDAGDADVLPLLVRHLGEPMADSSIVPTYHVARITRTAVTVALNGDGGDETLGGYNHYRVAALGDLVARLPAPLRSGMAIIGEALPDHSARRWTRRARKMLLAASMTPEDRYVGWLGHFTGGLHDRIAGRRLRESRSYRPAELARAAASLARASSPADRYMATDSLMALPGDLLVKMDIATMANSLEARSPFLDHEVAGFLAALPASYKVAGTTSKRLLRHAMQGILPDRILQRGKMGFSAPVTAWLKGPMRELFTDIVLSGKAASRGFIDRAAAERLYADHLSGRVPRPNLLWSLLVLELWFQECVDVPTSARAPALSVP